MNEMYEKIQRLCLENETSVTAMCRVLGINRSVLSELKAGRTRMLSAEFTNKIAEYFKVSPGYLLGQTDQRNTNTADGSFKTEIKLSEDVKELLSLYDLLTDMEKGEILGILKEKTRDRR